MKLWHIDMLVQFDDEPTKEAIVEWVYGTAEEMQALDLKADIIDLEVTLVPEGKSGDTNPDETPIYEEHAGWPPQSSDEM